MLLLPAGNQDQRDGEKADVSCKQFLASSLNFRIQYVGHLTTCPKDLCTIKCLCRIKKIIIIITFKVCGQCGSFTKTTRHKAAYIAIHYTPWPLDSPERQNTLSVPTGATTFSLYPRQKPKDCGKKKKHSDIHLCWSVLFFPPPSTSDVTVE